MGDRYTQRSQEGRQFLQHNLIAGSGSVVAGLLGFLFQAVVSHRLHPVEYGAAFSVMTIFTFVSLPTAAFSRLMSWSTSRELAVSVTRDRTGANLLRSANRRLLLTGAAIALVTVAAAGPLASFLQVPPSYLMAGAIGLPFTAATPVLIGELQGEQRVGAWVSLLVATAAVRTVVGVGMGVFLGAFGVLLGSSIAAATVYASGLALVRRRLREAEAPADWTRAWGYVGVTLVATVATSALLNTDVILVKHLFKARAAGEYSAVTALGRSVFWGMMAIGQVLFPKLASRSAQGRSGSRLLVSSLTLAVAGGLAGFAMFSLLGSRILVAFAGQTYVAGSSYLGLYAIGMVFYGGAMVMVLAHQSLGRSTFLWVLIPITVLLPALILAEHSSLRDVVVVLDFCMGLLVVALTAVYAWEQRTLRRSRLVPPAATWKHGHEPLEVEARSG